MKKVIIVLVVLLTLIAISFIISDYRYFPATDEDTSNQHDFSHDDLEEEMQGESHMQEQIARMTLDEKIGQLFIVGIDGPVLTDKERDKFERNALGGAILFQDNLEDPEQSVQLLNDLKAMETVNDIPLFLSVDQEGGRVTRLPGLEPLKSAEEIGATENPAYAFKNGQLLGRLVHKFGFQVDFAPVLDIHSNPENTVIGDRAFADNPKVVSAMGIKLMEGIQDQGVIPAVKHFPGHGDTVEDSHFDLPVLEKTREELDEQELIPFKDAVDAGTDMVLISHIVLPELGSELPASMSKEVQDILREEWEYDGVIVTDDLTMGAITDHYPMEEAVVKAVQAGTDVLLVAHGEENLDDGIKGMKEAVANGEISEERLDESVRRILELKQRYKLNNDPVEDLSIDELNKEIKEVYEN